MKKIALLIILSLFINISCSPMEVAKVAKDCWNFLKDTGSLKTLGHVATAFTVYSGLNSIYDNFLADKTYPLSLQEEIELKRTFEKADETINLHHCIDNEKQHYVIMRLCLKKYFTITFGSKGLQWGYHQAIDKAVQHKKCRIINEKTIKNNSKELLQLFYFSSNQLYKKDQYDSSHFAAQLFEF